MHSAAELLEKAAEYDRLANETKRPAQKTNYANLAECYRFMAQQQAMIDASPASTK